MELRNDNRMGLHQLATLRELEHLRLNEKTPRELAMACWDIKLTLLKNWGYEEYEIETINDVLYLAEKKEIWLIDLFKTLDILGLVRENEDE